jgi:hypothetical protein
MGGLHSLDFKAAKMNGRTPTRQEKDWMLSIRPVGCIVCILHEGIAPFSTPEEHTCIHHIDGQTKPGAHLLTVPLCHAHHQGMMNSRHQNKRLFVKCFGTEDELLEKVKRILDAKI